MSNPNNYATQDELNAAIAEINKNINSNNAQVIEAIDANDAGVRQNINANNQNVLEQIDASYERFYNVISCFISKLIPFLG